ncbi:MAG: holo-ACP synthase [Candidatus Margulisbacteria bacterium]|nr:holo-ACP synthase [Candidatus Margulisiibacteriota bacterium]
MIKGIGIDIIEIDRIKAAVEKFGDNFLRRIYTEREISYCRKHQAVKYPELAVRFAAKEAYAKALGTGIDFSQIGWKDVEVVNNSHGKPLISFKGDVSGKVQVSLSHSRDYAVASVYVEE